MGKSAEFPKRYFRHLVRKPLVDLPAGRVKFLGHLQKLCRPRLREFPVPVFHESSRDVQPFLLGISRPDYHVFELPDGLLGREGVDELEVQGDARAFGARKVKLASARLVVAVVKQRAGLLETPLRVGEPRNLLLRPGSRALAYRRVLRYGELLAFMTPVPVEVRILLVGRKHAGTPTALPLRASLRDASS